MSKMAKNESNEKLSETQYYVMKYGIQNNIAP